MTYYIAILNIPNHCTAKSNKSTSESVYIAKTVYVYVHAGIDGYSRLVTYLKCSNNNTAGTVLQLFLQAIREYGCPSRV